MRILRYSTQIILLISMISIILIDIMAAKDLIDFPDWTPPWCEGSLRYLTLKLTPIGKFYGCEEL